MLFLVLYLVMCLLWSIFCLKAQHAINGFILFKDILCIILNFSFAPISLIIAIKRVEKDFKKKK